MHPSLSAAVANLQYQFEHVTQANVDPLMACYALHARFKDPFQEVHSRQEIKDIFLKMYDQLSNPIFQVKSVLEKDQAAVFLWDFHFAFKRWNTSPQHFTGVSWLEFDDQFLVIQHTDYWDPAAGIYEHLPVIGALMRGLKSLA